jgi:NAD(P)-dependent dehydrogenase (short-subunit alcohol dehydrogenase family)
MDAAALLRPGLLAGRTIALGGGSAAGSPLAALGATTAALPATLDEDDAAAHVRGALTAHGRVDALVHDLRPAFAGGGADALRATLELAWVTIRAVANEAFIPGARGGRAILLAPSPGPGPGGEADADAGTAEAARAAAENLARTLSIEWARHQITTVAVAPGARTTDDELAALTAYLASPAGDYFSGTRLSLGELR